MTLENKAPGIYLDDSIKDRLGSCDAIIFDCDGVLVDVRESYDLAIKKTTRYVLEKIFDIKNSIDVDSAIIDGFKATGGFNDEVDLTYAAILSFFAATKLSKDQAKFVSDVISNADSSGIVSVENYVEKFLDISIVKEKLSYPDTHHSSRLYQIFDQIFYGPSLYQKIFKKTSQFPDDGLIENDIVIVTDVLMDKLQKRFRNNMAIVTGRGFESISYSLGDLLTRFDVDNSAFLEDQPREMAKPNPASLIKSLSELGSHNAIFVGDSMEDLIMATKSSSGGRNVIFCGIVGTSKNPQGKIELFRKNNAKIILESINLLPKVLNLD